MWVLWPVGCSAASADDAAIIGVIVVEVVCRSACVGVVEATAAVAVCVVVLG